MPIHLLCKYRLYSSKHMLFKLSDIYVLLSLIAYSNTLHNIYLGDLISLLGSNLEIRSL